MTIFLRQLGIGVRFVLCRTGQKYVRSERTPKHYMNGVPVIDERDSRCTTLHHSCYVKPIVKLISYET